MGTVTGRVTVGGVPVKEGTVMFHPVAGPTSSRVHQGRGVHADHRQARRRGCGRRAQGDDHGHVGRRGKDGRAEEYRRGDRAVREEYHQVAGGRGGGGVGCASRSTLDSRPPT